MTTVEIHARELYAFERLTDPTLPAWGSATWMTRARWLRAASDVRIERVA